MIDLVLTFIAVTVVMSVPFAGFMYYVIKQGNKNFEETLKLAKQDREEFKQEIIRELRHGLVTQPNK